MAGRQRRRVILSVLLAGLLWAATTSIVAGHAFGPFSISVYSRLVVESDQVRIRWVLDMAEIASAATVELIDEDADGTVTDSEKNAYFDLWVGSVLDSIELTVDGEELSKTIEFRELTLPSGEGGTPYLRVVMDLSAELPRPSSPATVHAATYRDANYVDYPGWREVAAAAGTDVVLLESSVPTEGRTNELTVYPADLGRSVPTSEARFSFSAAGTGTGPIGPLPGSTPQPDTTTGSAFQIWPTGILAVLIVGAMAVVLVLANRNEPRRHRR